MKLDKRIEQAVEFGVKEIKIKKEVYSKLKEETKRILELNKIKINFSEDVKEFETIF